LNLKRTLRQVHYWLSLAVFVPAAIMFVAGVFLMLKKEVAWIQPPTSKGIATYEVPAIDFEQMLETSRQHPEAGVMQWSDIDRIDVRTGKGIAKVRSKSGWEVQIDTNTGEVHNVAFRRSDVIEQIHDGSYFSKTIKLFVFLPTGVILIIMWGTGLYMFLIPRIRHWRNRRKPTQAR